MADIARAAEIGDVEHPDLRRARRIVRDLELAGLMKSAQFRGRVKGKTYASNEYWVRVPWVAEPAQVTNLPRLGNDEIPFGTRVKELKGGRVEIDVDYYIRQSKMRAVNGAPEPYLDGGDGGKSGAGDTFEGAKSGAGDSVNRAPGTPVNGAPEPAKSGIVEPGSEAASSLSLNLSARARANQMREREHDGALASPAPRDSIGAGSDIVGNGRANGHQASLPGLAVSAIPARPSSPAEPRWPCPDCGSQVLEDGRGHSPGCPARGRGGRVEICPECHLWVSDVKAELWHQRRCSIRLQLVGETATPEMPEMNGVHLDGAADVPVVMDEQPPPPDVQARARALIEEAAMSARSPRRRKEQVAV